MKVIKAMILSLVLASTTACSALEMAASVVQPKPAVSVEAQVGEEANKQVVLGDQNKTSVESDTNVDVKSVTGDINSVTETQSNVVDTSFSGDLKAGSFTINNMPTKQVLTYGAALVFLLGLLFPSPFEIVRYARVQMRKVSNLLKRDRDA